MIDNWVNTLVSTLPKTHPKSIGGQGDFELLTVKYALFLKGIVSSQIAIMRDDGKTMVVRDAVGKIYELPSFPSPLDVP